MTCSKQGSGYGSSFSFLSGISLGEPRSQGSGVPLICPQAGPGAESPQHPLHMLFWLSSALPSSCIYPQDGREKWNRPPSPLTVRRKLHPEVPRPVLFPQYTPSGKGCSSPGPCPAPSLHPPGLRKTLEVEVGSLARLGRTQKTGE